MADTGAFARNTREIDVDRWYAPIPISPETFVSTGPPATRVTVPTARRVSPLPRRTGATVAFAAGAALLTAAAGFGLGVLVGGGKTAATSPGAAPAAGPSSASMTAAAPAGPCDGLAGALVTAGGGNRDSPAGVVAAFEYAYYVDRNPAAALALTAPEARLDLAALTVAIAALAPGTQHCVAATQTSPTELSVVLVVAAPGKRSMHRQVLTVTPAAPYAITGFREN